MTAFFFYVFGAETLSARLLRWSQCWRADMESAPTGDLQD